MVRGRAALRWLAVLLAGGLAGPVGAQVTETFASLNAPAGGSYGGGAFVGVGGQAWTFAGAHRIDSQYNIEGRSLGFGPSGANPRYLETRVGAEGVGELAFEIRSYFTSGAADDRRVRVELGGKDLGTFGPTEMGVVRTVTIPAVNLRGDANLRLTATGTLQVVIDNVRWTAAPPPKPEPASHARDFRVVRRDVDEVELGWAPPFSGAADGYLVVVSTTAAADLVPVDAVENARDEDLADELAVIDVSGESVVIRGMASAQTYYARVYPYANRGVFIDYRTAPAPPLVTISPPVIVAEAAFGGLGGWSLVPTGTNVWSFSGRAVASGTTGGPAQVVWLVSPVVDTSDVWEPRVRFRSSQEFADPLLSAGETFGAYLLPADVSDPEANRGTRLAATLSPEGSGVPTNSGALPVTRGRFRVGFRYENSGGLGAQWALDRFVVYGEEPPPRVLIESAPTTVAENGGVVSVGLRLSEAPAEAATLRLTAEPTGRLGLPAGGLVSVAAGTVIVPLILDVVNNAGADPDTTVRLRAEMEGYEAAEWEIVVLDDDQGARLVVTVDGGTAWEGTGGDIRVRLPVVLSFPLTVGLSLSPEGTGAVLAATSVTIPAGTQERVVRLDLPRDAVAQGDRTVNVVATAPGFTTASTAVLLKDRPPTVGLTLASGETGLREGSGASLRVRLDPPPVGGVTVRLRKVAGDPAAVFPATVTVAGSGEASVSLNIPRDFERDGDQTLTLAASAPGYVEGWLVLTVQDADAPDPKVEWRQPTPGQVLAEGLPTVLAVGLTDVGAAPVVVLRVDGEEVARLDKWPYAFEWQPATLGVHRLRAEAIVDGEIRAAAEVSVRVGGTATTVTMSPVDGQWPVGQRRRVAASVSGFGSLAPTVRLYSDGLAVDQDSSPPFEFTWAPAEVGAARLWVEAVAGSLVARSEEVEVSVGAAYDRVAWVGLPQETPLGQ